MISGARYQGGSGTTGPSAIPLDLIVLPEILDHFRAAGVEALAVCLLHAYANPAHEQSGARPHP